MRRSFAAALGAAGIGCSGGGGDDPAYYWSSTTVASATSTAWQASFLGGAGLPGLAKTGADAYMRCVRDP